MEGYETKVSEVANFIQSIEKKSFNIVNPRFILYFFNGYTCME